VASAKAFFGEAVEEAAAPPPKPARSAAKPTAVAQGPSESRSYCRPAAPPRSSAAPRAAISSSSSSSSSGSAVAQDRDMILWVDKHVPRRISEASAALGHAAMIRRSWHLCRPWRWKTFVASSLLLSDVNFEKLSGRQREFNARQGLEEDNGPDTVATHHNFCYLLVAAN
jgi:hypothetical protein